MKAVFKNKKAVIFDLDGTIADTVSAIAEAVNMTMESFLFPIHTDDEVRNAIGNGATTLIRRLVPEEVRNDEALVLRVRKVYDEMYEDLNDLISVICPIESKDDQVWEKGARSIIMATLIAMLEDSENPDLKMTKEKFNFFNLNKIIANSENKFKALKEYLKISRKKKCHIWLNTDCVQFIWVA